MKDPLVSVVMPVWNGGNHIATAIDSVLAQTLREFELVIVDDGSADDTRKILARYADSEPRIRPIYAEHRGIVPSLNEGCEAARGKYIARLDYDDLALPERLHRQVEFLDTHPRAGLVGAAFQYIDVFGERLQIVIYPPTDNVGIRQRLREANCFCHSAVTMRREVFRQVGGYRSLCTEAQDYDLWMRFADKHELANLPAILVLYRIHSNQISLTRIERQGLIALAVRASTEIRRKTGIEPLKEYDSIDRASLARLGIGEAEIDGHLVAAYLACISALPRLGMGAAALQALRDVVSHKVLAGELESWQARSREVGIAHQDS